VIARLPALRRIGLLLLALAVFARVLVPAGYMPSTDGAPGLVICTGQGAMTLPVAAIPMKDHAPGDGHDHQADHACQFAAVATVADVAGTLPQPVLPFASFDAVGFAIVTAVRPGLGLAAPPPPKTGPPSFA
jgi:hypothetical protein